MVNQEHSTRHAAKSYGKGKKAKLARLKSASTTNRSALVRIYIEGGAPGSLNARFFREAWAKFLSDINTAARSNGFSGITIIQGGGRYQAHDAFQNLALSGQYDLNILLIDSEIPGASLTGLWTTMLLPACGNLPKPSWATDDNIYFMVPTVEAWIMTDHEALANYYRRDFDGSKLLSPNATLEAKPKADIDYSLKNATKLTKKGVYSHGESNKIIEFTRPSMTLTLPHAQRLFTHLVNVIIKNDPRTKP